MFPADVSSGVSSQPVGFDVMDRGALNRLYAAAELNPQADYIVAIESGLVFQEDAWYDVICTVARTRKGSNSRAYSAHFHIPTWIINRVFKEKTELGEVIRQLADGGEKDAMKYLSKDVVKREDLIAETLKCALAPILSADRYAEPK